MLLSSGEEIPHFAERPAALGLSLCRCRFGTVFPMILGVKIVANWFKLALVLRHLEFEAGFL